MVGKAAAAHSVTSTNAQPLMGWRSMAPGTFSVAFVEMAKAKRSVLADWRSGQLEGPRARLRAAGAFLRLQPLRQDPPAQ